MIVHRDALYRALAVLIQIEEPGGIGMPSNRVSLIADGQRLRLSMTDGITWAETSLPAEGELAVCLEAKELLEFIKPNEPGDRAGVVELLATDSQRVDVAYDCALMTFEQPSEIAFPSRPRPAIAEQLIQLATWKAADFRGAVGFALLAAGGDPQNRPVFGALFERGHVIATDGSRLHMARLEVPESTSTLVSKKALTILLDLLPRDSEVTATASDGRVTFSTGECIVDTEIINASFPRYRRVLQHCRSPASRIVLESDTFIGAIKRLRHRTRTDRRLKLVVNGELTVTSPDGNARSSVFVLSSTHRGTDFETSIDRRFLLDALEGDGEIVMRFGGPLDPVVFERSDRLAVVMPLRT